MPPQGGKGEEKDVSGGLPQAASALLPLCCLSGRAAGGGGDSYSEKDIQSPGHQVEAVLLEDMWIRQEYDCNHFGAHHPSLHTRILGASTPDQRTATPVGGWRRA